MPSVMSPIPQPYQFCVFQLMIYNCQYVFVYGHYQRPWKAFYPLHDRLEEEEDGS